nr:MAG TPA: hypothetical protein [Caudoviricetes sp.]
MLNIYINYSNINAFSVNILGNILINKKKNVDFVFLRMLTF